MRSDAPRIPHEGLECYTETTASETNGRSISIQNEARDRRGWLYSELRGNCRGGLDLRGEAVDKLNGELGGTFALVQVEIQCEEVGPQRQQSIQAVDWRSPVRGRAGHSKESAEVKGGTSLKRKNRSKKTILGPWQFNVLMYFLQ
jgi:hypothetical protein